MANDVVVTDSAAAALTVMLSDLTAVELLASATCTVKFDVPAAVGVPLMTPAEERVRPAGSVPADVVHVNGVVPPVAVSVCEYAAFTVPFGRLAVVIDGADDAAAIVIVRLAAAVNWGELESATCAVKLNVPAWVGVPLIVPLLAIVSPGGSVPALRVHV